MSVSKYFLLFLVGFTFSLGYSQSKLEEETNNLRDILKVFFVPVETNTAFLKNEKSKINLGRHLFYEERLSVNSKIACYSCHDLNNCGTNGSYYLKQKAEGDFFRDVPTLYNVATLPVFNADGGIRSLKEKLYDSFFNRYEMNLEDENLLVKQLQSVKKYSKLFESAFPNEDEAISFNNVIEALEFFIKGLSTPAPIDRFIKGDNTALSKEQIEGGHVFNDKNCYSCHTGSNVGGQMIQKLGIEREWPNQKDLGYYRVKRLSEYKMFFRVAPLRNVEKTAPYFHDGLSSRLWQAVKLMGKHERGLDITTTEALKISEFLKTLTGEIPLEYIKKPNKLLN